MSGKLLILLVFCALPSVCRAQDNEQGPVFNGIQLRDDCHMVEMDDTRLSDQEEVRRTVCEYYVLGVYDGFRSGDDEYKICVPQNVNVREMALVVSKYLYQHPERLHDPVPHLVIDALYQTFPCSSTQ